MIRTRGKTSVVKFEDHTMTATYKELLQEVVPRPITTKRTYTRFLSQVERLICKPRKTRAESDMIALLSTLIEQYEIQLGLTDPVLSPQDRLMGLMEARQITQTRLAHESSVPRSTINEILSGKRSISKVNAARFAKFFGEPIQAFITTELDE